ISTAEDAQSLIRQLQEMWLFGKLDTIGDSRAQHQNDENAKVIATLLKQLTELQQPASSVDDRELASQGATTTAGGLENMAETTAA
ncbi:hypothetical protein LTR53_016823, partial [Teratosphaeriaceae sp. CCFEE 6253]